jgi:prepilin-type N-terminal cleavage/methylation domain-containing protein
MKNLISMPLKSMAGPDASRTRDRGFTLIELLVTLAVASIVMAAIYSVYAALTRSYTTENAYADAQQAVRATIDLMAEDIMMAGAMDPWEDYGPCPPDTAVKVPEIIAAGSQGISIRADRNMDGDVCDDFEDITYRLATDPYRLEVKLLMLRDNNSGIEETFIENVLQLEFKYYRENAGDTPTDNDLVNGYDLISHYGYPDPMDDDDESEREEIRTVEISITVDPPAGRDSRNINVKREYTTRVRCRNAGL